jgi:hypothetical protein
LPSPFTWWPEVAARLRALGVEPNLAKAERNFDENGNGKPVTPAVPEGWRHVPSADGIGVLAPARFFTRRRCRSWNASRTSVRVRRPVSQDGFRKSVSAGEGGAVRVNAGGRKTRMPDLVAES